MAKGQLSFLSPDKEAGPFLLYYVGSSFEEVALKTGYPVDLIYMTAMRYEWIKKSETLRRDSILSGMDLVKEDLLQSLLIATQVVVQKELADVIAGRKDAKDCALLPKNINGLKQLVEMIDSLKPKVDDKPGTVNNFQFNLSTGDKKESVEIFDVPKSKLPPGL